jgi:hypothetical protein
MTSEKKIAANRINARKSRGPRTAAGKARVSFNAFQHGLAALKHLDPTLSRDIDLIARAMCGDDINPLLFEQAVVIAESEMVLRCIRVERVAMIERLRDIAAAPLVKRDNRTARAKGHETERVALEPMRVQLGAMPQDERTTPHHAHDREAAELALNPTPLEERDEVDAMREAIPDLNRLTRYERQALSRHKRALRRFMDVKFKRHADGPTSDQRQPGSRTEPNPLVK